MIPSFLRVFAFPPGWILTAMGLVLLYSTAAGCRSAAAYDGKVGEGGAINHVQNLQVGFRRDDTIRHRIESVVERSRQAGLQEEVVGWSARQIDEYRYLVFFGLHEDGRWIGFEWFVNLRNGWVNPTNQYASWVMSDKRW